MLGRTEQAIAAYDTCLNLNPRHVLAHYNRATALARLQRWGES